MESVGPWEELMREALRAARRGVGAGQSPFGAVVATSQGAVVCAAHNRVRTAMDPTAHAEVSAIREACSLLNTGDLSGHVIVTTCEPCCMCAGAIHWARLDVVAYGASIADAARAGFSELTVGCQSLYERGRSGVRVQGGVLAEECRALFRTWQDGPHPVPY